MKRHSRVYARINLDAVEENFCRMRENIRKEHGALPIARLVEPYDYIWGFAVATVEEAVELREHGIHKPILILGFTFSEDYEMIAQQELRPAVFKLSMAKELSRAALHSKKKIMIHLALDTGMTRIGFADNEESIEIIREITALPGLEIEGMFTHFARADETDKENAREQLRRYLAFARALERAGISVPLKHCSNSAGILELPEANLDAVRAGITIYGIYPSDEMDRDNVKLHPVMELKSHIAYIKTVEGSSRQLWRNLCYRSSHQDCHYTGRLWGRISQKPEQRRLCPDPWKAGQNPGQSMYGSVYGGCHRYSGRGTG